MPHAKPEYSSTLHSKPDPFEPTRVSHEQRILSSEQEICVAIWLDETDLARRDDLLNVKTELERIVKFAEIFDDEDECVDYVTYNEDCQVLLIVSESDGGKIVSVLHEFEQLKAIYVLSSNRSTNVSWIKKHKKGRGVISSIASICRILGSDKQGDSVEFNFVSSLSASLTDVEPKNEQEVMFMYGQLLKYVLTEMSYSKSDRSQMFDFLHRSYQNPTDIKQIDQFEKEYHDDQMDPIEWYTKDLFLYKDLNKALREHDITYLYSMRVFVKDLHQKIVRCRMQSKESTILKLYRGMQIPLATLEEMKQKSGRLLSFNCFLSTTTNCEIAVIFSEASSDDLDKTSVIFEIDVDHSICTPAHFIDISNRGDEQEFLFTMGSVFRIKSIEPTDDSNAWRIKLLLTDENDAELTRLTNCIRAELGKTPTFSFYLLMHYWGNYDKAKEIYQLVLQTISEDLKPLLSTMLAYADIDIGNNEDAASLLQSASNVPDKMSPISTDNVLAYHRKILHHIIRGEWDLAVETIEAVLPIETNPTSKRQQESLGLDYAMIGSIRLRQGRYSDSSSYATKAYELFQNCLPVTHPHIAHCLQIMAASKIFKDQSDEAFAIMKEAARIREHSLPPEHPHRVAIEVAVKVGGFSQGDDSSSESPIEFFQTILNKEQLNMANDMSMSLVKCVAYFETNRIDDALSCINKIIETMKEKHIQRSENQFAAAYLFKAECHRRREEVGEVLESYNKAYEDLIRNIDETYPFIATVLSRFANVYAEQNEFDQALAIWAKCNDRPTGISREDVNAFNSTRSWSISNIYRMQGVHYQDCKQYDDALVSFKKCLEIRRTSLPMDYIRIERIHWYIGHNYLEQEKYDDALSSFQESLNIIKEYQPTRTAELFRAYKDVGKTFRRLEKFSDALVNFENALKIQLESLSPTDPSIADTRKSMGFVHCEMGNPEEASFQFSKCLEMDLTEWPFKLVEIARGYFWIGYLYEEQQQNEKALFSFRESLRIWEKCSPINTKDLAITHRCIGGVLFKMEKFSDALQNYQRALDLQLQVSPLTDASIAHLWRRIGIVYVKLNDFKQAFVALKSSYKIEHSEMSMAEIETLCRSFILGGLCKESQDPDALTKWQKFTDFQARSLPASHSDRSNMYRMIGLGLSAKKKHSDAIYNFQRALDIRLQSSSTTDPELAKDYQHLGIEYVLLQRFDEALSNLQKCLSIQTNFLPSYHPHLGDTHFTMGQILKEQQKLPEALDHYESASKIFLRALSSTNLETSKDDIEHWKVSLANIYSIIGDIHTKRSNFPCALQNFQYALNYRLQCTSSTWKEITGNRAFLVNTYVAMNNYERALFICRECYKVTESRHPVSNADSFSEDIIRTEYFSLHSLSDSVEHCQRFLEFQMSSLPSNHPHLAPTYVRIGRLLAEKKMVSEALDNYRRALNILLRYLSPTNSAFPEVSRTFVDINLSRVYHRISMLLCEQQDMSGALENLQHTLDIQLQYFPSTDLVIAETYLNLGQIHIKLKQYEKALPNFERALVIQAVSLPPDHLDLVKTHTIIGNILSQQQKPTRALESYECALQILFESFASANIARDEASIKLRNSSLADIYFLIGNVQWETGDFSEAHQNYQLALDVQLECTSSTHPKVQRIVEKLRQVQRLLA